MKRTLIFCTLIVFIIIQTFAAIRICDRARVDKNPAGDVYNPDFAEDCPCCKDYYQQIGD
jgi:hypothetical protein